MSALVFLDTETTGLSLDDEIWEFAAIRRERDGEESRHHLFLQHDTRKCSQLPASFIADHRRRFPNSNSDKWHPATCSQKEAAKYVAALFEDRPHVVGAVPNFDTERLAVLLGRFGHKPGWHYHLIDVEALAVGFLFGRDKAIDIALPWDSDSLSSACGVQPPGDDERHTAMGDALWVMRLYDAVTGEENP